jgi:hypothetical protein
VIRVDFPIASPNWRLSPLHENTRPSSEVLYGECWDTVDCWGLQFTLGTADETILFRIVAEPIRLCIWWKIQSECFSCDVQSEKHDISDHLRLGTCGCDGCRAFYNQMLRLIWDCLT